jgi:ribonuclease VapC
MTAYVLDASAMLAYIYDEAGAERVGELLKGKGATVYVNAATLGEVFYDIMQEEGKAAALEALAFIRNSGIKIIPLDEALALSTAQLKGSSGIPYVDGIAAATALQCNATLVTLDPDFERVEDRIRVEWLSREV